MNRIFRCEYVCNESIIPKIQKKVYSIAEDTWYKKTLDRVCRGERYQTLTKIKDKYVIDVSVEAISLWELIVRLRLLRHFTSMRKRKPVPSRHH